MVEEKQKTTGITPFESFNGWDTSKGDYVREAADVYDAERSLRRTQIIKRIAMIAGISVGFILFLFILSFVSKL